MSRVGDDGAGQRLFVSAMPVQSPPVRGNEQRPFAALADGQVDRAGGARGERDGDDLAALAGDDQGPWPHSSPRCSMSAPVAADTRGPLRGLYGTRVGDVAVVNSARSSASFSW